MTIYLAYIFNKLNHTREKKTEAKVVLAAWKDEFNIIRVFLTWKVKKRTIILVIKIPQSKNKVTYAHGCTLFLGILGISNVTLSLAHRGDDGCLGDCKEMAGYRDESLQPLLLFPGKRAELKAV